MRKYTPRRANKARWLQGAPEYVLDIFDNGGKTFDRYTVLFTGNLLLVIGSHTYIQYLDMSESPTHPQGLSQWGEMDSWQAREYRHRSGRERVRWLDLPEHIRQHVTARATEGRI